MFQRSQRWCARSDRDPTRTSSEAKLSITGYFCELPNEYLYFGGMLRPDEVSY